MGRFINCCYSYAFYSIYNYCWRAALLVSLPCPCLVILEWLLSNFESVFFMEMFWTAASGLGLFKFLIVATLFDSCLDSGPNDGSPYLHLTSGETVKSLSSCFLESNFLKAPMLLSSRLLPKLLSILIFLLLLAPKVLFNYSANFDEFGGIFGLFIKLLTSPTLILLFGERLPEGYFLESPLILCAPERRRECSFSYFLR